MQEWLIKEAQWFKIDAAVASRAMKDVYKHYKRYLKNSRKQTQYLKDNWSFDIMCEKLNDILPKDIKRATPQQVQLELPKLKKIGEEKQQQPPQIELPTLKKV